MRSPLSKCFHPLHFALGRRDYLGFRTRVLQGFARLGEFCLLEAPSAARMATFIPFNVAIAVSSSCP